MKSLSRCDAIHLEAAKGWCELRAFIDADAELDEITPQMRAHPDVLIVRWQIYAKLQKWEGFLGLRRVVSS
jgi:hypothetical protein